MKLEGQQQINASREDVFAALNDPEILKLCIPGCETLNKESDTQMAATVKLKIGPVTAKFAGEVTLSNINPPESYTIAGEGKGGPAGFAKGGADVRLEEVDGGTLLSYEVKADLGGKMAQLGARLMDSTAKRLSGQFFKKFAELVENPASAEGSDESDTSSQAAPAENNTADDNAPKSNKWLIIGAIIAAAVIALSLTN